MDEQTRRQSPIFARTSNFILWLLDHTEKYPKSERFRLARRMEDCAFSFYELLIEAVHSASRRKSLLIRADLELEKLRLYVRMAHARKLATPAQYRFAAEALIEIGKLLGGWLKSLAEHPSGTLG